jgi:dolichol-phosphate mannosyltransferase
MNNRDKRPGLAVVIPMFNEEAGAQRCIKAVTAVLQTFDRRCGLIVVEDGSRDRTLAILERLRREGAPFTLVPHGCNRGYGAGLKTGATEARRQGYEYVLFMDSDLTNPPEHIAHFFAAMDRGVDVIKGCRYVRGGRVEGVPFKRYIISRLGNFIVRPLFFVGVRDATNGFRCLRTDIFLAMPLTERGFAIIMEELYWGKRFRCKFANVPTTLYTRSDSLRATSFSYKPSTFYRYLRYAFRAAALSIPFFGWRKCRRPEPPDGENSSPLADAA